MKVDGTLVRSRRVSGVLMGLILASMAEAAAQQLPVCLDNGPDPLIVGQARAIAGTIFSGIGVETKWYGYHNCPAREYKPIMIHLSGQTADSDHPAAFAYALPFEGMHIDVFYDRVQHAVDPGRVPNLLAHVLVHEITHIIQGTGQHASSGMMKARWDAHDYFQMGRAPLGFSEEDLQLIRSG